MSRTVNDRDDGTDAFIFMKVGDHAGESFEEILERKGRELDRAGMIFWGYGGATCHPIRQVQPFVKQRADRGLQVQLLMQFISSDADPEIVPATEYSVDGEAWKPIPDGIQVTGSKYALVLDEIRPGDLTPLVSDLQVGIGPSTGKPAGDYLRGRVDKGCLVRSGRSDDPFDEQKKLKISYRAVLKPPYAVKVR